ncbi:MAG: hypothetical protein WC860_08145 [Candidatus Margulisiibacteriota bacterium]|jgi:hypothetical protein
MVNYAGTNYIKITPYPLFAGSSMKKSKIDQAKTEHSSDNSTNLINNKILLGINNNQSEIVLDLKKAIWIKAGSYFYKIWFQEPNQVCFQRHVNQTSISQKQIYHLAPDEIFTVGSNPKEETNRQTYRINDPNLAPEHFALELAKYPDGLKIKITNQGTNQGTQVEINQHQGSVAARPFIIPRQI